jgi:hypothetical protein
MKEITMSSLKHIRAGAFEAPHPTVDTARRAVAMGLRSASAVLARLSRRLAKRRARVAHSLPVLEFYAEAGAPEGALYLDGQLVGWIRGVRRL